MTIEEKARHLGFSLSDHFHQENISMGLTVTERNQCIEALDKVLVRILVGSLDLALVEMDNVTPIANILEQSRIDKYKAMLANLIGVLSD